MENKELYKYIRLILGSVLFAGAIHYFVVPVGINAGGLVGLAQIFDYLVPWKVNLTGFFNFLINVPLFILGFREISRDFCIKTALSIVIQTIVLSFLPTLANPIMPDILSNCIIGAVLGGIGVGLCLTASGSAGGSDILGVYLSQKNPDASVGKLNYAVNFVVLGISAILFDLQVALFSIIFIMIMYYVSDRVHYQNINVLAIVITERDDAKKEIIRQLGRGVTYWYGKGAYRDTNQEVLMSCISKYEVRLFKRIVNGVDPKAFVILSESNPVQGNFEKRL